MNSTAETREQRCASKLRFPDRTAAKRARRECSLKYGKKFSLYRCEVCGGFHVTTMQVTAKNRKWFRAQVARLAELDASMDYAIENDC